MGTFSKSLIGGAAMVCLAMSGQAQAGGTSPAFPFAATGFLSGGGAWTDSQFVDYDIATIVGGGDFVIPLSGYWNIQLGGAWRWDKYEGDGLFFDPDFNLNQFHGGAIGFWRDPSAGVFGLEAGLYDPTQFSGDSFIKLGAVAEFYVSDMATLGGFGGVYVSVTPGETDTGFYAGGHATYYMSDVLSVSGIARYQEITFNDFIDFEYQSLRVGGKLRYLTSMPGVELNGSAFYHSCHNNNEFDSVTADGVEIMAGIQIYLGGRSQSLVDIDRSNALDTRTWDCDAFADIL